MAYSSIVKPGDYFNTVTWSGDSTNKNITGVGFQPDLIWGKCRNTAYNHKLYDSVRTFGNDKELASSENTAQGGTNADEYGYLSGTVSDGFTTTKGSDGGADGYGYWNESGRTYVAWNWKAGTTGSGTTGGSGYAKAYSYSVNTTAGFSIVKYKGNGTAGHTIPHHLGAVPKMIIVKRLDGVSGWHTYHASLGNTQRMSLNETDATGSDSTAWNDTTPTSSVFTVGNSGTTNVNDADTIAYCFAEKTGYSKFGKYIGNGNADGTFVYTGFKPAFIIAKKTSGTGGWQLRDNKRTPTGNLTNNLLNANASSAEQTTDGVDFLSNGLKFRNSAGDSNASGGSYIYMAFAEEPLVANSGSNGVPATAK